MASFMKNVIGALKSLTPYVLAVFGTVMVGYMATVMFGFLDLEVVPSLGLNNNSGVNETSTTEEVSNLVQSGADGVYNVVAIVLISTGLMALATVMQAFNMRRFERFNIGSDKLVDLVKKIGQVTLIYTGIVFVLAIVKIIFGYLEDIVTPSLGFESGDWVVDSLQNIISLLSETIDQITPLLDLGVGLVTLGLVLAAFGFQFSIDYVSGKRGEKRGMSRDFEQ